MLRHEYDLSLVSVGDFDEVLSVLQKAYIYIYKAMRKWKLMNRCGGKKSHRSSFHRNNELLAVSTHIRLNSNKGSAVVQVPLFRPKAKD